MIFIGITGGVGAGKSAILNYMKENYCCRVMLADEIAHELMQPGSVCYDRLLLMFGMEDVWQPDGQFDNDRLASVLFSDSGKREALNCVVHPAVKMYVAEQYEWERERNQINYLILEAALLIEEKYDAICDELWYIYTSEENRRERLKQNRGYSDEKIDRIFASQLSEETFRAHCAEEIDNNSAPEEYMELCSIASGSSGNCIYAGTEHCHLLIDAGISGKRIEAGLNEIGLKTAEMDGVLVTHEHSDHIKSLGVIARKYGLPIYATQGTIDYIHEHHAIGDVDESLFRTILPEVPFRVGDMTVTPFSTSHDAAEPVAYIMRKEQKSMAVVTDLGIYDHSVIDRLQGLDVLLLEANHDVHMLQVGAYPYRLKQRILGEKGHLSNELSGQLLGEVLHDRLKKVVLGHLSKENNYPRLACESVKMEVTLGDNPYKGSDFPIEVAKRDTVSEVIVF